MPTLDSTRAAPVYPEPLRAAERAAVDERRRRAGVDSDGSLVGVALSGGGIRSATFCLGLFQALARQKLIRRIDFLSTVSGGGYFGSFLGTAFSRDDGSVAQIETELADNQSWSVKWLRENGRFLSPNGSGDNWVTAAVALRNWAALHLVLLTFSFFLLALSALIRADLWTGRFTGNRWSALEGFFFEHQTFGVWWSPWLVLPVIPFAIVMIPWANMYWLTQFLPLMALVRRVFILFRPRNKTMTASEFVARSQAALTRGFTLGLIATVALLGFALIDSIGQTAYLRWSSANFAAWAFFTGTGAGLFAFGSKIVVYLEPLLGKRRFQVPFSVMALGLALVWTALIVLAEAVIACGFAWRWERVWDGSDFQTMSGGWPLLVAILVCFGASWFFSRAFGFVNLSSMQQIYAARLSRAYLGATNPLRRASENHNMTELITGDDLALHEYAPHEHGGPVHLINVTVNETVSGKTQVERRDRKGLAMALGPCGLSVGIESHALWAATKGTTPPLKLQALFEARQRAITPIPCAEGGCFHALCDTRRAKTEDAPPQKIEALALGRWVAISGAAFTTGTGANTSVGLSLLLGLANIRLGYWWDSGIASGHGGAPASRPNFLELASRLLSRVLPVQTCLMTEFFARFHGPARRHWYLSDGGHFENTACYELIRRRVPFIICSDAGQDPNYEFGDLANLVRKARIDFGAEIQVVRRAADLATDDPGVRFPMPKLEELVHPNLLDVIGTPDDFGPLEAADAGKNEAAPANGSASPRACRARAHALLARIHYTDTDEFSWLLLLKPSLMGDETTDVIQYQRTHALFPQEPTTDQYFAEAQWESYRKLGEHIGTELFTPPAGAPGANGASWSPSQMHAPEAPQAPVARAELAALAARLKETAAGSL
jgi:hypothetical protein